MTEPDQAISQAPSVRGMAAILAANSSLLIAGLVYMGWAYLNAEWGYFHLSPLSLGVGVVEYLLRSLSLFSPVIVLTVVVFISVTCLRAWDLDTARGIRKPREIPRLITSAGLILTTVGLTLAWLAEQVRVSTYLVLALFCVGPLLLTWPTRAHRHGRTQYALAIVVAAVCILWAGSLYASTKGTEAAQYFVRSLPADTAVTVYSVHRLDVAGPEVTEADLGRGLYYRYQYRGLRLLTSRSGTYYLLPLGWTRRQGSTLVVTASDQVRIDLYSAEIMGA
jgi:hypothetical protein